MVLATNVCQLFRFSIYSSMVSMRVATRIANIMFDQKHFRSHVWKIPADWGNRIRKGDVVLMQACFRCEIIQGKSNEKGISF